MKFRYAVILALVALVAATGFASADRLPSQVPENQIFTIDTLIDVTGAVSEESEMQWTLDDMNRKYSTAKSDGDGTGEPDYSWYFAEQWLVDALDAAGITYTHDDVTPWYLVSLEIPDDMLDQVIDNDSMPGYTYQMLLDDLEDGEAWSYDDEEYYTFYPYAMDSKVDKGYIHNSKLNPTEEIMILTWTDSLRSNGGKLSLNKNIDFDSQNKGLGLSNLEVEKVLTYASTEGAHLVGAEEWTLDVAGNWEATEDSIRCVFASTASTYFPAFCNVVKAKSELVNINSAQISTKGAARGVAASGDIPAMLNYQIAVTPDSNSGSGFADGTVKTLFGGSIMEARGKNQIPSATNNWKDSASVTGGIKNFQKTFTYESGFKF